MFTHCAAHPILTEAAGDPGVWLAYTLTVCDFM